MPRKGQYTLTLEVGKPYGRLAFLREIGGPDANGTRHGLFQCECGKEYTCSMSSVKSGLTQSCGCLRKDRITQSKRWKGDDVGYKGLHMWVGLNFGKPSLCEHCGRTDGMFHWANKSGEYKRDRDDWMRLCVACHHAYDGNDEATRLRMRQKFARPFTIFDAKTGVPLVSYWNIVDANSDFGVSRTIIGGCLNGRAKTFKAGQYRAEFVVLNKEDSRAHAA